MILLRTQVETSYTNWPEESEWEIGWRLLYAWDVPSGTTTKMREGRFDVSWLYAHVLDSLHCKSTGGGGRGMAGTQAEP